MEKTKQEKHRILELESEIMKSEKVIIRFKKNIPFAIIGGILFSFIFPYIPGRRGRKPMIETWEYSNAVIFFGIIYFIIYLISYLFVVEKKKDKIASFKRTMFSIENQPEPYR